MPPKKESAPNKKTVEKKKEKVIEDKTFGIKNKKGKKQQVFIKQVTNQVKFGGGQSTARREGDVFLLKKEKADREKEKADLDSLFRPVAQVQKVSAGADPKSVLCLFFKQGHCSKGDKCKFSHDLSLENKTEKKSLYVDARDLEQDTIDNWDTGKLEEVVMKKHSAKMKSKNTDIVCKHFLHAIDKGVYGWFWECPSGGDKCIYRHALPPGFVLKKQKKDQEDMQPQDTITLDELVETEREALSLSGMTLTKVTLESFLAWKKRKLKERSDEAEKSMEKKKEAFKHGKTLGISGREMFLFNPELVVGDDEDEEGGGEVQIEQEFNQNEGEVVVDLTNFSMSAEGSAETVKSKGETSCEAAGNGNGAQSERGVASANQAEEDVAVDEELFLEDVDEEGDASDEAGDSGCVVTEEPAVDVDESLFDVDNLQDLNLDDLSLDDPFILETPGGDS